MFKKSFLIVLALLFVFSFASCSFQSEQINSSEPESSTVQTSFPEISFDASVESSESSSEESEESFFPDYDYFENIPYIGLYNADTLEAYYTENADTRIYPASLTKMVTASVALKYCHVDDIFPVGTELSLVQPHSSLCGLRQGMSLSLEHLLYGLLLPSGNDAAYTIAVNVARRVGEESLSDSEAVEYFCGLMNDYCAEIGANNSRFTTPEGWDDENQYTTVNDLALIASKALESNIITAVVSTAEKRMLVDSGETFNLENSNRFLHPDSEFYDPAVIGIKTGTTDNAGACLVGCVTIEGQRYIAIAAGCPDDTTRFQTVAAIIDLARDYVKTVGN